MNAAQIKTLALIGVLLMAVGAFLPLERESDSWADQALFSFDRFDGSSTSRSIRNGLTDNLWGISLFILAVTTAYAALNFDGLGGMVTIIFVYLVLLFYLFVEWEMKLSFGWLFLFGGWLLIAVANFQHGQLPSEPLMPRPSKPAADLGRFSPPSE
ncbi:MAG: hypothetical protein JXA10_06885 [Anaerolineae bacterium]|nr:hypothetical protein [Anaerolineae bacterium]